MWSSQGRTRARESRRRRTAPRSIWRLSASGSRHRREDQKRRGPSRRSPQTRLRTMVAPSTPGPARDRPALIGDQTGALPDGGAPSRTRSPSPPGWRHPAPADGPPLGRPDGSRVAVLGRGLPSPCSSSRDGGSGAVAISPGSTVNSTTAIERIRDPPSRIRPKTPAQAARRPHNPSGERRAT